MPKPAFANENKSSLVKKISRFIRGNFFLPDPRKGWQPFAVRRATSIIAEHNIDFIITAGPPHSTHFIGKALKQKFDSRWMADFHDLWTDVIYYSMLYHLPFVKKKDKNLEKIILKSADIVTTVGDKYKEKLLSKSGELLPRKFKVLRIGCDEQLFATAKEKIPQDSFVITYTGTIADFYQPEVFIDALKAVVQQYKQVKFILRFAGVLSKGIKDKTIAAGLGGNLVDLGYVPHRESVSLLLSSTVLLLVNPVTKDEGMVIPGKIYEYLAARKPIINICTAGSETAAIIKECDAGKTFDRQQLTELQLYLAELVEVWLQTKNIDPPANENVQAYSTKEIAQQLMAIIEG